MHLHKAQCGLVSAAILFAGFAFAQDEGATAPAVKPRASQIMALAPKNLLLDITTAGERLIAVGDRGHVLHSTDGNTWTQSPAPVRAALTAVSFADAQNGWAVGHDATIIATRDGGMTWTLQNFQPELEKPFLDVVALSADSAVAVGAYGLMYRTTDAGKTWAEVDAPAVREEEFHFNSITRLADGSLFIAGEQGMMGIAADGENWTRLTSPYESSLFGALPMGEKGALVFGLRGNVFISDDAGAGNWREINSGTVASMFGGTRLADGRAVLAGLNGALIVVDAAGTPSLLKSEKGTPLSALIGSGDGVIAVGESGVQRLALQ